MVRKYREQCEASVYHVSARGVGRQIIFESDADKRYFGGLIRRNLKEIPATLLAWCFMDNHIHLLIQGKMEDVSAFMHRVLSAYAKWFNLKYDRSGHLFEGRFDSVAITSDEQLLTAIRYIHRNPLDIPGASMERYPWSSYREYVGNPFICDTTIALPLFGGVDPFIQFHHEEGSAEAAMAPMEMDDAAATDFIRRTLGLKAASSLASLPRRERDQGIALLKRSGMSVRQISRITGIGRNIVQRAKLASD